MNEINKLKLYRSGAVWVYDDSGVSPNGENFNRQSEVLVPSITEMIDGILVANVVNPENHFNGLDILFASENFGHHHAKLDFHSYNDPVNQIGHNYELKEISIGGQHRQLNQSRIGYLCPALLDYFSTPPQNIYVQFPILNSSLPIKVL